MKSLALKILPAFAILVLSCSFARAADVPAVESSAQSKVTSAAEIPSLDELAGDWMEVKTLRNYPSVNNFWGGLRADPNLTSFIFVTFPPYANGGYSGVLTINGKPVTATESRWYPYQVLRRATVDGVDMESAIRMPFEQRGVFCRLTLKNTTAKPQTLDLSMQFTAQVRKHFNHDWDQFSAPHGWGGNTIALAGVNSRVLTGVGTENVETHGLPWSAVAFAFAPEPAELKTNRDGGTAGWKITLAPGEATSISYTMAIDQGAASATALASHWAETFEAGFAAARTKWEDRWQAAFTPGNTQFSGHFPTLVTSDEKLRRVYYHGAMASFVLMRTNFNAGKITFSTAGPIWAVTTSTFWDTAMFSGPWAMLDPVTLRENLCGWLTANPDLDTATYGNLTNSASRQGTYAASDWSIFRAVDAYLSTTGDKAFLKETIKGKTVLEHLVRLATAYRAYVKNGQSLADYGPPRNLLECAPQYVHCVPSFNAADVFMLRRAADYLEAAGEKTNADALRTEADKMRNAVLSLYVPGEGVWMAQYPDGKKVQLRHCLDYIVIGQAMAGDLSPTMKTEMTSFVERELMSGDWLRAMSLKDTSAASSDRPDHGPKGSYDGWPPLTMESMCRLGAFDSALRFLHRTESITHESTFSQAHEFVPDPKNPGKEMVRVASRGMQDTNEVCGGAFMQTIINSFFGFHPDVPGDHFALLSPQTPRGFMGRLDHVTWHGKQYTIISDEKGVHAVAE